MKRVIYTVIVDGYDRLIEQSAFAGWDFVCFNVGGGLGLRAGLGLSNWQVRAFDTDEAAGILRSRLPKVLAHRFLGEYDYSIYIDGNAILTADPKGLCEELDWPDFAVAEHPFRTHLMAEFDECARLGLVDARVMDTQKQAYTTEGLPDDTQLLENNLILRRHNDAAVIELDTAWWEDLGRFPHRDQLSLPYAVWKTGLELTTMSQQTKRRYFRTKAHYRSMWNRLRNSFTKRKERLFPSNPHH